MKLISFDIKKTAVIIFTLIALGFVFADTVTELDYMLENYLSGIRTPLGLQLAGYLSFLGSDYFLVFMTFVFAYFMWAVFSGKTDPIKLFLFTFACDVGTGFGLKHLIGRDRPLGAEIYETTYSFPSGHAVASIFFYLFAAYVIFAFTKISQKGKYAILLVSTVVVFLISLSRLYLGVHYLSDVIAGLMIGYFWLNFAVNFLGAGHEERKINVVKAVS